MSCPEYAPVIVEVLFDYECLNVKKIDKVIEKKIRLREKKKDPDLLVQCSFLSTLPGNLEV